MIAWDQLVLTATATAVPLFLYLWKNKIKAKEEQDERHAQNQLKLNNIITEQRYLEPHFHNENEGPLLAAGIRRRPRNGS